jgi:hypothetical protein
VNRAPTEQPRCLCGRPLRDGECIVCHVRWTAPTKPRVDASDEEIAALAIALGVVVAGAALVASARPKPWWRRFGR